MFLKIKIREEDQDAQRFYWRENNRVKEPEEYPMSSMLFGAKSSPCTALFIKNKNASLFTDKYPATANSLTNNCYMDDFLDNCKSYEEASERINQVIEINKNAKWEVHGWASNFEFSISEKSSKVNNSQLVKINLNDSGSEKVLGVQWLNQTDELAFNVNSKKINNDLYTGNKKPTKREFLAIIMAIFDPLGLLTPFTIVSRILMQDIWLSGVDWDEELHDKEFSSWRQWLRDLQLVRSCRINRCYQMKKFQEDSAELHVFCDASEKAYGAVAYWRFTLKNKSFHVAQIIAKSRVAPLKVISIPRLELQAAVLATRIAKIVCDEHNFKITRRVFWCDSVTVLRWIKREPRVFKIYVANRLAEINENTLVSEWKWVPTRENSADYTTRAAPDALNKDSRWFNGPQFLLKSESDWPEENFVNFDERNDCDELKKNVVYSITEYKSLIEFSRFSSWIKLLRVVKQVFRVADIIKKRSQGNLKLKSLAEELCIKISQNLTFGEEIRKIRSKSPVSKNTRILALNPIIDERGILRAEGRLINFLEKPYKPIILDSKENLTKLIPKYYHEKFYHGSNETILNELKQKFCIFGLRQGLRSLVAMCLVCKMRRANPAAPKIAPLPQARIAYQASPFTHCGLDYFGPMLVKIGRRREKRWGALFTCLTTRAIHLELAHSLTSDSAIMALKRFMARRGMPLIIYCDNGTNFRGMSRELKQAIEETNNEKLVDFVTRNNIEWRFNPPTASHMGGAWERLIRSVKTALSVVLREQAPKEETLLTILAEIEHTINSRPLTHVSLDPRDQEALTPNHFLLGTSSGEVRFGSYQSHSLCTRKQWRISQNFADAFWKRWLREFLPTLISEKNGMKKN